MDSSSPLVLPFGGTRNQTRALRAPRTIAAGRRTLTAATSSALDPAPPAVQTPRTPPPPVKMANEEAPMSDVKPKKEAHMKRMASAGLQIDSVLGRKTENLKEIYGVGRKLGQGQFGTTFLSVDKKSGQELACKTIPEDVKDVRREIQIMHHLSGHPNVIQIVGVYEDAVAVHVVMEICAGGELFDRNIQRGHYTERKAAELARTIVGVIEACHSLGVMYCDLKPDNFLFVNGDEEAALKTIDFGLSVFFKPDLCLMPNTSFSLIKVLKKHYSHECDVWSAGVIIYILLSGVPPFWDETEQGIFGKVLKGDIDFCIRTMAQCIRKRKRFVSSSLLNQKVLHHFMLRVIWVRVDGVALDKPLYSAVLTRLTQFSAMNKLKKIAIKVIAESLSEEEIAGLKEMFKMIDTDNSGHITLEELKKVLDRVGANLKDSEILGLMQAADIDNSGTIDFGEFIAAMVHLNKIEKEDHMFIAFSYFDKDGSGYTTRDELQQACKQFGLADVHLDDILT
ncbi:hypothetical protein Bca4012_081721 [Brassica carinata]